MEIKKIFENINFVNRYQEICKEHNDFENRMHKNNRKLTQEVLDLFDYKNKYFSNGSFYQIKEEVNKDFSLKLHFVLKGGIVETLFFIEKRGEIIEPQGRIDFFPEELEIPFERLKYGALPKYCSEEELKNILREIFSIYEDIKIQMQKH